MARSAWKAGPLKTVFALLLLFGPALFLIFISTRGCEHKFKVLDDYGAIKQFRLTTVSGKQLTNKDFKNKIVIFTTIQATCPDTCGVTIWHLDQLIYQQLRKNKKRLGHVKLVSIVTNGKGGKANNIKDIQYMLKDRIEGFDESIWIIASGDARGIYNKSNNGESLLKTGKEYLGGQAFQELMLLVDKKNHLRMVLPGKTESTIRTMRDHMALLEKEYDKKAAKENK